MKSEDVIVGSFVYISTNGEVAKVKELTTPEGFTTVTLLTNRGATLDMASEQSHHVDDLFALTAEEAFADRLASAWLGYTESLKFIFNEMSDEELRAYLGDELDKQILPIETSLSKMLYQKIAKRQAQWTLTLRSIFGVFCVYHKCDSKDCPQGFHNYYD